MLEHHADAQGSGLLRPPDVHRLAVESHLARIGVDGTVDDLHQGALARTVFAQEGVDLPGLDRQVNRIVGHHRRVPLGDAPQGKPRHGTGHCGGWSHGGLW